MIILPRGCMKRSICAMSYKIFVINPGGYIGQSTRREIEYALSTGKAVNYLVEMK